jgi:hypothetical protein
MTGKCSGYSSKRGIISSDCWEIYLPRHFLIFSEICLDFGTVAREENENSVKSLLVGPAF